MKHLVSIALALMVAVTFGSASWAGDKGKANGYAFGKVGDNNPLFKWTPEADSVTKNSEGGGALGRQKLRYSPSIHSR